MRTSYEKMIVEWRRVFPSSTKTQCAKALNTCYTTVNKYWDVELPNYYQLKKEIVQKWRKENPEGQKFQCVKETKISWPTVDKYWEIKPEKKKTPPVSEIKEAKSNIIQETPATIIEEIEDDSSLYNGSLFD